MNSKYFKYAIGEIILVVLGILIALSVNNWNEERKRDSYEKRMLKELSIAIENDINVFENYVGYIDEWNKSILYLIDAHNTQEKVNLDLDTVKYHLGKVWGFGIYIVYNNGPYEALKSSGLDKIKNDNLRNQIARLYSFELPSLDTWINEIIRIEIVDKFELFELLFDVKVTRNGDEIENQLIVKNLDFLDSPIFADILDKASTATQNAKSALITNKHKMNALLDLINQELD